MESRPKASTFRNTRTEQIMLEDTRKSYYLHPTGIGGWLILLIVKLGAVVIFRGAFGVLHSDYLSFPNFASALLAGCAAYQLLKQHPRGVVLAKLSLMLEVTFYFVAFLADFYDPKHDSSSSGPEYLGQLVADLLWLSYTFRSRRIQNTYYGSPDQPVLSVVHQIPEQQHSLPAR